MAVEDYQDELKALATKYGVMPSSRANFPPMEVAAIFQSHAASTFLKGKGQMGLVMPRSFFSSDHHKNTRSGKAQGFRLKELWDLDDVEPVFRVPSCVLFSEKANARRQIPKKGIPGYEVKGRLPSSNVTWEEAEGRLSFQPVTWYLGSLGSRTAFTTKRPSSKAPKGNPYKSRFRQGATIVPRNGYFVVPVQDVPDLEDRDLVVETDPEVAKLAKRPYNKYSFEGRVNSRFLFRTAQAKSLLPFVLFEPELVVLPLEASDDGSLALLSRGDLRKQGHLDTAGWFKEVEEMWEREKTQKAKAMSFTDRLNFQQGFTQQHLSHRWLVLYNSSGKDANAVVVEQGALDRPFVVDYRAYWAAARSKDEAYYLAAFLNADWTNKTIKDYQSRGLLGPRDVSKTILEVPFVQFDPKDEDHKALVALGRAAAEKGESWAAELPAVDRPSLGRLRLQLRRHLAHELKEIDKALRKIT